MNEKTMPAIHLHVYAVSNYVHILTEKCKDLKVINYRGTGI